MLKAQLSEQNVNLTPEQTSDIRKLVEVLEQVVSTKSTLSLEELVRTLDLAGFVSLANELSKAPELNGQQHRGFEVF